MKTSIGPIAAMCNRPPLGHPHYTFIIYKHVQIPLYHEALMEKYNALTSKALSVTVTLNTTDSIIIHFCNS